MTDYFDELNITPLGPGEQPNHFLHMARLLRDFGTMPFEVEEQLPPPSSKAFVDGLQEIPINDVDSQCPICLKTFTNGELAIEVECKHSFHSTCIKPWLQRTSTCPVCRFQFKTDDEVYEAHQEYKKREQEREEEIENLHSSMFS